MFYYNRKKCQQNFFCIKLLATEILFCLFVNNLIQFCLFVDAGQKGLRGFECKRSHIKINGGLTKINHAN